MLTNPESQRLADRYLGEVCDALAGMPWDEREEILDSVKAQLAEAIPPDSAPEDTAAFISTMDRPEKFRPAAVGVAGGDGRNHGRESASWRFRAAVTCRLAIMSAFLGAYSLLIEYRNYELSVGLSLLGILLGGWGMFAYLGCRRQGYAFGKMIGRNTALAAIVSLLAWGTLAWQAYPADSAAPKVVKTVPEIGAKDVSANLQEIVVYFDKDMAGGFSWCGGGEAYPETAGKPVWKNKRTCALPVRLVPGKEYRLSLNSPSFKNFRSAAGAPLEPVLFTFTTSGEKPAEAAPVTPTGTTAPGVPAPKLIKTVPELEAKDVSPDLKELRVTFDQDMKGGFSWCGGGETYPETTDKPRWENPRTCVLPVKLQPGKDYHLSLNARRFHNFCSMKGVPLEPVPFNFSTAGEKAKAAEAATDKAAAAEAAPQPEAAK